MHTLRGERAGRLDHHAAAGAQPVPGGDRPRASAHRKVKEAITALKIEAVYTKDEILETYLNTVPFLYNAFGIEMAARTYFDKSADKLDVLESATLIGMLKGTSYYNPVLNPERARDAAQRGAGADGQARQAASQARSRRWQARPLRSTSSARPRPIGPAPHVAQQLRKWLIDWADRNDYDIYADGLVVRTTIDSRLQKVANQAVARQGKQLQRGRCGLEHATAGAGNELVQTWCARRRVPRAWTGPGADEALKALLRTTPC